jgi:hypothetical protein
MTSAFGGQRSIQLSYGCPDRALARRNVTEVAARHNGQVWLVRSDAHSERRSATMQSAVWAPNPLLRISRTAEWAVRVPLDRDARRRGG